MIGSARRTRCDFLDEKRHRLADVLGDADAFRDTAARVRSLLEEHLRHENGLLRGSLFELLMSLELWSILRVLRLD